MQSWSDQTESIKIGANGPNQVTETYQYDALSGLLTNQRVTKGGSDLLNLSYDYARNNSVGNLNGKTGHLTKTTDNLNNAKNKEYEFDALRRLTKAKGGNNLWSQTYSYDRFGNRTNVVATGNGIDNAPIQRDGTPSLTYDNLTNRITTSGYQYDVAGNQTRSLAEDGTTWLKYEYDAANRLQNVKKDDGTANGIAWQSFQYGSTNQRLMDYDYLSGQFKIFGARGAVEYTEFTSAVMTWSKTYTYLGDSILSTITPNGNNAETTEFNHPDRLGTKIVTNQQAGTSTEQATLPFGTALSSETTRSESKRFTSYERSARTGLDYAVNRTYDSKLGRFSQIDPIGMNAVRLTGPQTLNLYSYCGNDPINHTDPNGLFFGSFFRWLGHLIMNLFRSGVAKKIAIKFVVAFAVSGGNFGVAIRSILPDILTQLGLNPNPLLTPSWNPGLRHPISLGTSSLSRYIISNLIGGPKTRAFCSSISGAINAIKHLANQVWDASNYGTPTAVEQSGKISFSDVSGEYFATVFKRGPNQSNVASYHATWTDGTPRGRNDAGSIDTYYDIFDIHTHPFDTGQEILITGDHIGSGKIQKVLDAQQPSRPDKRFLDPKLIGLIVTSSSIVVYTQVGRRCTFAR